MWGMAIEAFEILNVHNFGTNKVMVIDNYLVPIDKWILLESDWLLL